MVGELQLLLPLASQVLGVFLPSLDSLNMVLFQTADRLDVAPGSADFHEIGSVRDELRVCNVFAHFSESFFFFLSCFYTGGFIF